MSFQTRKTFVHLRNTNKNIFDEIRELSDPPIDSKGTITIKVQKRSKDIDKIVHVTSVVQPEVVLTKNCPSLTEFFLSVTEKSEGRPSFWQITLRVIYCKL